MPTQALTAGGTQSFVGTLSSCWKRPSLVAIEIGWRWLFGVPALLLVLSHLRGVVGAATEGTFDPGLLGLDPVLLNDPVGALSADPMGAAGRFARAIGMVLPGIEHFAVWLVPLLLVGWVVISSLGRTLLLRRIDRTMQPRVFTVAGLQAIRVAVLAGVFWLWLSILQWASRTAILEPIAQKLEPNLVLYCGLVIVSSLAIYTGWAFVSWVLHVAPLLAMATGRGVFASLGATLEMGRVRGKLVEVNLVLGIVKIALIVLAMVFSATPLPFESVTTPDFLAWWWSGVAVLYLTWSDFFHVARLVGYLELWRASRPVTA